MLTDDELKQRAIKFHEQIQTLIHNAKSTTPKASVSELDVTLNLRVNKQLRADFDRFVSLQTYQYEPRDKALHEFSY